MRQIELPPEARGDFAAYKPEDTLSQRELEARGLQETVAQNISARDPNLVLKGGAALGLAHEWPRSTQDLDFDRSRPDPHSQGRHVASAMQSALAQRGMSGGVVRTNNTDTTRRFRFDVPVDHPMKEAVKKVEISYRDQPRSTEEAEQQRSRIEVKNGIRLYNLGHLALLKSVAFAGRDTPRDAIDAYLLLGDHYDQVSDEALTNFSRGIGKRGADVIHRDIKAIPSLDRFDAGHITSWLDLYVPQMMEQRGLEPPKHQE